MSKPLDEIRKEIEIEERDRMKLLETLEIPEYTNRTWTADWVANIDGQAVTGKYGLTALAPKEVSNLLNVGDSYILETKNFSRITGWLINGKWYDRKSDQDIKRENEEHIRKSEEKMRAYVKEHHDEWTEREAKLPDWLKDQMTREREAESDFETRPMGWGYALVACELAVMYAEMGEDILDKDVFTVEDTDEIREFANKNGTSGNQHGFALMLAKQHTLKTKENN